MEDKILHELETIRRLLTLDKKDELRVIHNKLNNVHLALIDRLSTGEWTSGFIDDVAEEIGSSPRSARRRMSDLIEWQLVVRRGQGAGTEYRKTGLAGAAELVVD